MQARMNHPAFVVPGAMDALQALGKATQEGGVDPRTRELVGLRAGQINGCSVCVQMHTRDMRKAGETEERIAAVSAWYDAPHFTEAERAALALAEAVTRLADRSDAVPDDIWDAAAKHYDEKELANLVLSIALVNLWNRLNRTTRVVAEQIPG